MTLENHKVCQVVDLLHFDAIYEIFVKLSNFEYFLCDYFFLNNFLVMYAPKLIQCPK